MQGTRQSFSLCTIGEEALQYSVNMSTVLLLEHTEIRVEHFAVLVSPFYEHKSKHFAKMGHQSSPSLIFTKSHVAFLGD